MIPFQTNHALDTLVTMTKWQSKNIYFAQNNISQSSIRFSDERWREEEEYSKTNTEQKEESNTETLYGKSDGTNSWYIAENISCLWLCGGMYEVLQISFFLGDRFLFSWWTYASTQLGRPGQWDKGSQQIWGTKTTDTTLSEWTNDNNTAPQLTRHTAALKWERCLTVRMLVTRHGTRHNIKG